MTPAHFMLRPTAYAEEVMPRTHHGGPGRPKKMAEDDLMLSVP